MKKNLSVRFDFLKIQTEQSRKKFIDSFWVFENSNGTEPKKFIDSFWVFEIQTNL